MIMSLTWDSVTETKCNIFGRVCLFAKLAPLQSITDTVLLVFLFFCVKSIFFFWMFIFQWIRYPNVVFWLRNMPSIKYVCNSRNGGGGGSSKMCIGSYRRRGVSRLMCTYALTDNYSFHVFVLRCLVLR